MPTTEAQILANRQNALKSTGPRTDEGKAVSRGNALKHGLTGAGVALTSEDATKVQDRFTTLQTEMKPSSELGRLLIQRVALLSIRMDRSMIQEAASLSGRVRQARADFVAPEGVSPAEADRLRDEAGDAALFDPSPQAILARRYEAAAERGFFRALKDFRQIERDARAETTVTDPGAALMVLASFLPDDKFQILLDALPETETDPTPTRTTQNPRFSSALPDSGVYEVPLTIGRARG